MGFNKKEFYALASEIVEKNNIMNFLSIVTMNISLSPNCLMLLYKQDKGTRTVCGKKAWEGFGRAVKEDAETR